MSCCCPADSLVVCVIDNRGWYSNALITWSYQLNWKHWFSIRPTTFQPASNVRRPQFKELFHRQPSPPLH